MQDKIIYNYISSMVLSFESSFQVIQPTDVLRLYNWSNEAKDYVMYLLNKSFNPETSKQ
jgi:hypothetical protein